MTTALAFVDTETTGLDPRLRRIWESAVILAQHDADQGALVVEKRHQAFVRVGRNDMARAEPMALRMTRFYERTQHAEWWDPADYAAWFAHATAGRHLVGAVPSFDERSLDDLLRAHGRCGAWHYHLIDIEALAAGYLARVGQQHSDLLDNPTVAAPPWKSDDLTAALGVTVDDELRHTAHGDGDWALRTYAAVYDLTVKDESWPEALRSPLSP